MAFRSDNRPRPLFLVENPKDVSHLLLPSDDKIENGTTTTGEESYYYVGPVKVEFLNNDINDNEHEQQPQPLKRQQRGLIATRDIEAGELLFATPPTLQAAPVAVASLWKQKYFAQHEQYQNFSKDDDDDDGGGVADNKKADNTQRTRLEECSEKILLDFMQQALRGSLEKDDSNSCNNRRINRLIAASFTCLTGSNLSQDDILPSMHRLNAVEENEDGDHHSTGGGGGDEMMIPPPTMTRDDLLQIIRHNAFGPDGLYSYKAMEQSLLLNNSNSDDAVAAPPVLLPRLLGLYPLAAMLNHSCCANAVRVFGGGGGGSSSGDDGCCSVMIVHSLKPIRQGEEIVWSYIPPTQPWPQRQATLQQQYQFTCRCPRCQCEEKEIHGNLQVVSILQQHHEILSMSSSSSAADSSLSSMNVNPSDIVQILENQLLTLKCLSNTAKAYLRVSYLSVYTRHLNHVQDSKGKQELLILAMHLHLSCCSAHYASTEHISILHWCYETVGQMHAVSLDATKTLPKVQFWTEQLKQVHMIRYGALGHSLETVRRMLKETRLFLISSRLRQEQQQEQPAGAAAAPSSLSSASHPSSNTSNNAMVALLL